MGNKALWEIEDQRERLETWDNWWKILRIVWGLVGGRVRAVE